MYKKNINITFKAIFSRFKQSLCILSTIVLKMLLDALNRRFEVLDYIQSDEKIIQSDEKII